MSIETALKTLQIFDFQITAIIKIENKSLLNVSYKAKLILPFIVNKFENNLKSTFKKTRLQAKPLGSTILLYLANYLH